MLVALSSQAAASAASLRYEAPSECPTSATLEEEIEHLLDSALADAAEVEVRVEIMRAAQDDWRVLLSVQDEGHGAPRTRVISGRSCAEAADAAALAAAIAIRTPDPGAERPDSAAKAASSTARPPPAATGAAGPKARRAATDTPATRFGLDASLLLDTGTLPSLAIGFEAAGFAAFAGPHLRARLFGGLLGRQEAHLSNGDGAKFDLLYAGLGGCGVKSFAAISGSLCAGMEAGSLRGEGLSSAPQVGSSLWLAPRVDVGLSVPLFSSGFSLIARGGAAFPLIRKAFVLDGDQIIHRPQSPTARVSAGVELLL